MRKQNMKSEYRYTGSERKLAKCLVCGDRVYNKQDFITAEEGYCHRKCLNW